MQKTICNFTLDNKDNNCWRILFFKNLFIYFDSAGSSLSHGFFFPVVVRGGYSLVRVHELHIPVASLIAGHGLRRIILIRYYFRV